MSALFTDTSWTEIGAVLLCAGVALGGLSACSQTDSESGTTAADTVVVEAVDDSMTIDRVLRTDRRFSTLVAGLDSTRLDTLLGGTEAYTLFAPSDTAFDALPSGTMAALLGSEREQLRTILRHHVVPGRVRADRLAEMSRIRTLSGDSILIRRADSTLRIGNAGLLDADIEGINGVIHVIDHVLRPPSE